MPHDRIKAAVAAVVLRWGRRWLNRYATHIMSVSGAALDVRWPNWRTRPDRYVVWTAGVDTTRFAPPTDAVGAGEPVIISVGSLNSVKRHDVSLHIFASVLRSEPAARLVFVGEGPLETRIRTLAERLGVVDRIEFAGLKDREMVAEMLRSATVFLSSSATEGLPNCLLEAQASGIPVVASDIRVHREALAPELHDHLFAPEDPAQAATTIAHLLNDAALRRRLGEAGRRYVQKRYGSTKQMELLEEYYLSWAGSQGGRP